jgi:hypothetical protein
LDNTSRTVFQNSEVKLWVYGGGYQQSGAESGTATPRQLAGDKATQLADLLRPSGAGDIIWGLPISYRADFLATATPAAILFATDYDVCQPEPAVIRKLTNFSIAVSIDGDDGKDGNSSWTVSVTDAAGRTYAEKRDLGQGVKWNQGIPNGPWQLTPALEITEQALNSGLTLRVVQSSNGRDTTHYHLTVSGIVQPGGAQYMHTWTHEAINESTTKEYRLPSL